MIYDYDEWKKKNNYKYLMNIEIIKKVIFD
jgi:hypothetical protein